MQTSCEDSWIKEEFKWDNIKYKWTVEAWFHKRTNNMQQKQENETFEHGWTKDSTCDFNI